MDAGMFAGKIVGKIDEAGGQYYRLLLVVAPTGGGKTGALELVGERTGAPLVSVSKHVSRELLALSEKQRALQLPDVLEKLISDAVPAGGLVLLDNLEILFDPKLAHDPLRLLQKLSRNRTIVAAWPGELRDGEIVYAEPGHPQHRRYPITDFLAILPE